MTKEASLNSQTPQSAPTPATRQQTPDTARILSNLYERLGLLAQLGVPCTILIFNPALRLGQTPIKAVELAGDCLTIAGDDFKLLLRGPNFHSIHWVNQQGANVGAPRLDIHHSPGMVYASIQPPLDSQNLAVWRDVMDNPSLSLT